MEQPREEANGIEAGVNSLFDVVAVAALHVQKTLQKLRHPRVDEGCHLLCELTDSSHPISPALKLHLLRVIWEPIADSLRTLEELGLQVHRHLQ